MKQLLLVALVVASLAGCTAPEPSNDPAAPIEPTLTIGERPTESFANVDAGPATGPDLNATTAAAPALIEGEWWRIRFDAYLGDELVEVVRVVADVNEEGYIMGMPHEGWLKEAISFHSPAFGDVNYDLSYNTHNMLFEPLRFPLVAGDSWDTLFAAGPLTATVESADDTTAVIVFESRNDDPQPTDSLMAAVGLLPDGGTMRLTYDARQHEIVRMESALGVWEVVEHGYDFEGWVTVPRGEDTAIDFGTFGPISETHTPAERQLTVEGGFNRMTMMHFVGTLNDAPASIEARDVTPEGVEFVTTLQGSGFQLKFYETSMPDGNWTVQDTVVGAGFTYHMGIAYHQYDIQLPGGNLRSDHAHAVIR